MERRFTRPLVASLIAPCACAALLVGCGSAPSRPADASPRIAPDPIAENLARARPDDDLITRSVRDQLTQQLPLAAISVSTVQGKVALSGTVPDSDAARRAVKEALSIDGVRGVVNELDVTPAASGSGPSLRAAASL